jgi:hypothetical protein
MSGTEDLDFIDLIFHLNSMPRVDRSFETTDSKEYAMSRLEYAFVIEKLKPFLRVCKTIFGKSKDKFLRIRSWGRQDCVLFIIKQG